MLVKDVGGNKETWFLSAGGLKKMYYLSK